MLKIGIAEAEFFKRLAKLFKEHRGALGIHSFVIDEMNMEIRVVTQNGTWVVKYTQ